MKKDLLTEVYEILQGINLLIDSPLDVELKQAGYAVSPNGLGLVYAVQAESVLHLYYVESNEYVTCVLFDDADYEVQPQIDELIDADLDTIIAYFTREFCKRTLREELAEHAIKPTTFYPFGIAPLDDKLQGIYMGSLTILAGKSNTGKTYYSLKFMESFIKQGLFCDYINLEMLDDDMKDQFKEFGLNIPTGNRSMLHSVRNMSLKNLIRLIKSQHRFHKTQIFIVDWLDRLIPMDTKLGDRTILQAKIADTLSTLAQELKIAIILVNQLNKSTTPANGVIDWYNVVAGSAQVYNVCDTFIGLFDRTALKPQARDDPKLQYVVEFHVEKTRKKKQKKGVVVAKSVNHIVRYLDFDEQYAYDEYFHKKGIGGIGGNTPRKNKLLTSAEERFKELEKNNNNWAVKLDPVYTGDKENVPF